MKPQKPALRLLVGLGVLGVGASLVVWLAYKRHWPKRFSRREWEAARESKRPDRFLEALERIYAQGVEPEARASIWPFLLGLFQFEQTEAEIKQEVERLRQKYAELLITCEELSSPSQAIGTSRQRVDEKDLTATASNAAVFAEDQNQVLQDVVRTSIPLHLHQNPGDPAEIRRSVQSGLSRSSFSDLKPAQQTQVLRLIDILCAYAIHDPKVGYCQGMSDLAVPFLVVHKEDFMAYSCFAAFIRSTRENFLRKSDSSENSSDSSRIRQLKTLAAILNKFDPELMQRLEQLNHSDRYHPLVFAFRMVLVKLRRELSLPEAMLLWEITWAHRLLRDSPANRWVQLPENVGPWSMLEFVIAAAIMRHRKELISCEDWSDVMTCSSLQKVRLQEALARARRLMLESRPS